MRTAQVKRTTKETDITLSLQLDGGRIQIDTGVGFLDHMLNSFATHGGFGLQVSVKGDLHVDCHHTVEDTGIVLGKALGEALGDKSGIARFGSSFVPMDEALAFAAVDVSGRPFLAFDASFEQERVGDFDTCMTEEFMRAFAFNAGITLHTRIEYGKNAHHEIEAMFKAVGEAVAPRNGILSTKGVLA